MSTLNTTGVVKKPHLTEALGNHELMEIARCTIDPVYFAANYCFIRSVTKGGILFDTFEYQERLIEAYHNNRYCVALMPRQSGKTTCAAAYILWFAMFNRDSTILIVSNKREAAHEIMTYIRYMYENCDDFIRAGAPLYNRGSIEFDNGSRILSQATTENAGRGLALSLVLDFTISYIIHRWKMYHYQHSKPR